MIRDFKVKQKAFLTIFEGRSVAKNCVRPASGPLICCRIKTWIKNIKLNLIKPWVKKSYLTQFDVGRRYCQIFLLLQIYMLLENIYYALKIFIFFSKHIYSLRGYIWPLLVIFHLIENKDPYWKLYFLIGNKHVLIWKYLR